MGGCVVTDHISLEIAKVDARAATTSNCITGTRNVQGVAVLLIDIKISGRGVVRSRPR